MAIQLIVRSLGIWGDSVLKGVVQDSATRKYSVARGVGIGAVALRRGIELINHSHFGSTVVRGRQTLERDLSRGIACDVAIIEYGGNDCEFDWQAVALEPDIPHQPHTPLELFIGELRVLVDLVRANNMLPILTSLPPIDSERYFRKICAPGICPKNLIKWLGDIEWTYRWHETYSNAIVELAREMRTALLDVRRAFLAQGNCKSLLCEDGIHPSVQGQEVIGGVFSDLIDRIVPQLIK